MRLLVTGRHGFVGSALARLIASDPRLAGVTLCDVPETLDLTDPAATDALLAGVIPDGVMHLAAQSFVPESFRDPAGTFRVNLIGTLHLLQGLQRAGFSGKFVFVSTGDVYGNVPDSALPIAEAWPAAPRNPYAVSKLAAELLCQQWVATEGMAIVIARPFNHIGAGQSTRFVVSDFARQVVEIRRGRREPIVNVGDIDVTRDFTDVGDILRGYLALLEAGAPGERYNLCSGREVSIRAILDRLAALAGVNVTAHQDAARVRRAEQRRVVGDPERMRRVTGWTAMTPLDASLTALLDYWERELTDG